MEFHGIELDPLPFPDPAEAAEARRRNIGRLRPRPCPCPLTRIGGERDGAYLVPDDLAGIAACFSPGVAGIKTFEDELLERFDIGSYLCDPTSDAGRLRTPLVEGRQSFRKVALAAGDGPGTVSLESWVGQSCPGSADLILQMDIEGAEYAAILATPRDVLRRFRVMVFELHSLRGFNWPRTICHILDPFLGRLTRDHVCVHLHPNNCSGQVRVEDTAFRLPGTLEVTLLRRDRFEGHAPGAMIAPQLPHPLDIPRNVGGRPPVFMDGNWTDEPPGPASEIARLKAEIAYLKSVAVPDLARRFPDY